MPRASTPKAGASGLGSSRAAPRSSPQDQRQEGSAPTGRAVRLVHYPSGKPGGYWPVPRAAFDPADGPAPAPAQASAPVSAPVFAPIMAPAQPSAPSALFWSSAPVLAPIMAPVQPSAPSAPVPPAATGGIRIRLPGMTRLREMQAALRGELRPTGIKLTVRSEARQIDFLESIGMLTARKAEQLRKQKSVEKSDRVLRSEARKQQVSRPARAPPPAALPAPAPPAAPAPAPAPAAAPAVATALLPSQAQPQSAPQIWDLEAGSPWPSAPTLTGVRTRRNGEYYIGATRLHPTPLPLDDATRATPITTALNSADMWSLPLEHIPLAAKLGKIPPPRLPSNPKATYTTGVGCLTQNETLSSYGYILSVVLRPKLGN
ncbi:hypothetical protein DFH27DRAFT_631607 [Peziza echinospora]|nr:hypothetical protein DFH27DRAFT_631607 [Peziza echinospora]